MPGAAQGVKVVIRERKMEKKLIWKTQLQMVQYKK